MNIVDTISMIRIRLKKKKLRTALAILGIAVGVMSVTAITSFGNSGEQAVFAEFSKLGINGINLKKQLSKMNTGDNLDYSDTKFIKEKTENVYISGIYSNTGTVENNNITRDSMIMGVNSDFYNIADLKINEGRFISESDNENENMVCLIDTYTKKKLFNNENPLGKTIKLSTVSGDNSLTICGILENTSGFISDSMPLYLYIPLNCVNKVFHTKNLDYISIVSYDETKLEEKGQEILKLVEDKKATPNTFYIDDINAQKQKIKSVTDLIKNIIGAIALISLIVGGIGVMNIMLVSVNERTKEIGIKKSIGAKNSDILLEFLMESLFITLLAGIIGIFLGVAVSILFSNVLDISFIFSIPSLIKIFGISFVTGIIFGGYPALIAANKDPVIALRANE